MLTTILHYVIIFLVPNSTNVIVTPPNTEIVGKSLTLECSVPL